MAGGGIFISSIVVGLVIIVNKFSGLEPISVGVANFMRDFIFYSVSSILVLAIIIDGKIDWWEAIGVLGIYGV